MLHKIQRKKKERKTDTINKSLKFNKSCNGKMKYKKTRKNRKMVYGKHMQLISYH